MSFITVQQFFGRMLEAPVLALGKERRSELPSIFCRSGGNEKVNVLGEAEKSSFPPVPEMMWYRDPFRDREDDSDSAEGESV